MARKKIKQVYESFQSSKPSNFISLHWDLYDSKAWSELSAYDIQLYMHMLRKYQRKVSDYTIYNSNKDNISLPEQTTKNNIGYGEFMTKRRFWECIDHLIELGLVKLVKDGYPTRKCSLYGFNDEWQKYGTEDFHIKPEWLRNGAKRIKAKEKQFQIEQGCEVVPYIPNKDTESHLPNIINYDI